MNKWEKEKGYATVGEGKGYGWVGEGRPGKRETCQRCEGSERHKDE